MHRSGVRAALAVAISALLATGPSVGSAAAASDEPTYFWRWSDGSERPTRLVDTARQSRIPRLVVATSPATSGQRVLLQFRDGTRWRTEDSATTRPDGTATLDLNPFCEDGDWCRRTFGYRLVAGGRTAALTVTFR